MTDKEKLKKLKKLADAMYYAAMYLTTDASRLHKAMDEYHKFIIHEHKEKDISSPKEDDTVYKDITMIDKDGNIVKVKVEQRVCPKVSNEMYNLNDL